MGAQVTGQHRGERWLALALLFCVVLVGFWEFMANRSRRPLKPFQLTAEDFAGFTPPSDAWHIRSLPVTKHPIEANILVYGLAPRGVRRDATAGAGEAADGWLSVRLVHGYNMPDCMRYRGDKVELIQDCRDGQGADGRRYQVWRLISPVGDVSLRVTSMLRAGDFEDTDVDTRSMPFPRIGVPDDPTWVPRGLRLESFRHPVRNFRWLMRAKWNNARCDLATFLKLRQPVWACEDMLTLVAGSEGPSVPPEREREVTAQVVAAHHFMLRELQAWRRRAEP